MHPDTDKHPKTNRFVNTVMIILGFMIPLLIVLFFAIWKTPSEPPEIKAIVEEWEAENRELSSSTPPEKNAWKYYGEAADILEINKLGNKKNLSENLYFITSSLTNPDFMNAVSTRVQLNPEILELTDRGYEIGMVFLPINQTGNYYKDKHIALMGFIILAGTLEEENGRPLIAAKRYLQAIHLGNGWFRSNAHFSPCTSKLEYSIERLLKLMETEKQNRELMISVLENTDRISDEWTTFKPVIIFHIRMIQMGVHNYNAFYEDQKKKSDEGIIGYFKYGIKKKTTEKELISLYKVILQYNKFAPESYSKTINYLDNIPRPRCFSTNVFRPCLQTFFSPEAWIKLDM